MTPKRVNSYMVSLDFINKMNILNEINQMNEMKEMYDMNVVNEINEICIFHASRIHYTYSHCCQYNL